jgi:aminoglycoside phosphotransferase (APT) family kinase protein
MALMQAVAKRVLAAEAAAPGTVLDHDFIETCCDGFDEFVEHISAVDDREVERVTGLAREEIDELADRYLAATGRSRASLDFWHVLGLWKVAVIVEGVVRRVAETPENAAATGAPGPETVDALIAGATRVADAAGL